MPLSQKYKELLEHEVSLVPTHKPEHFQYNYKHYLKTIFMTKH